MDSITHGHGLSGFSANDNTWEAEEIAFAARSQDSPLTAYSEAEKEAQPWIGVRAAYVEQAGAIHPSAGASGRLVALVLGGGLGIAVRLLKQARFQG